MQYDKKAKELRAEILKMLYACQSGHPGGSLSCVEMLMALYYEVMKVDPKNPKDPDRDRFVLSKGHACPTLYAILADLGFFPKEDLAEKQVLIGRIIGEAKQQLKNMPQEAYFENIVKLAVKASQNGKGTILFSKADLDRLPENFADTLNAALVAGGKEGAALTVSSETRDIDGGFVLTYGGIEENCSFDALFDSAHEMLQDKVQEILFGTV